MRWPWSKTPTPRPALVKTDTVVGLRRQRLVEVTICLDGIPCHRFMLEPDETKEFIFAMGMEGIALDRTERGDLWRIIPWGELDKGRR